MPQAKTGQDRRTNLNFFFRGSSSRDSGPKKGCGMVSGEREPWVRFCLNCPNCMDSSYDMDTVGADAQVSMCYTGCGKCGFGFGHGPCQHL